MMCYVLTTGELGYSLPRSLDSTRGLQLHSNFNERNGQPVKLSEFSLLKHAYFNVVFMIWRARATSIPRIIRKREVNVYLVRLIRRFVMRTGIMPSLILKPLSSLKDAMTTPPSWSYSILRSVSPNLLNFSIFGLTMKCFLRLFWRFRTLRFMAA